MTHSSTHRPRLVVAADGSLAAISELARVIVVDLPSGQPLSEIGIDRDADFDVAWVGTPPRLLVLARHAAHTAVHLLDPHGPQSIAEIELASAVSLFAAVGAHALVIGAQGAAVLTAGDTHLTPYQFPARARPIVAGAAGNQFVVAIPGVIEEWDPQARVPKRRLRLPRPTTLTAVGGSERVVWMIAQQEPARIDVLPLINRGQPKHHDLPEPIAAISGHPKSDLLACIGAESGRAYALDLDGRTRLRALAFPEIDRVDAIGLVVGRMTGVVAAQHGRPIAFVPLEARDPTVSSIIVPTRTIPDEEPAAPVEDLEPIEPIEPPAQRTKLESPFAEPPNVMSLSASPPMMGDAVPAPSPPTRTAKNLAARFAAVRERREAGLADSGATPTPPVPTQMPPVSAPAPTPAPAASGSVATVLQAAASFARQFMPGSSTAAATAPDIQPRTVRAWRDACVAWTREILERRAGATPPDVASLQDLAVRFELSLELVPALALLYGAHLDGHDGIAPSALAQLLDFVDERRWAEALGRGELAASGVAVYARSRVRLAPAVQRVLDELPPETGTLVGVPAGVALLGACVIVERGTTPIDIAARHAARAGGAILIGHGDRDAAEVAFEARAIGAAAMLRASKFVNDANAAVIYVADDDADADRLGLPRFA